jgi:type I restriction enzyme S subunit
MANSSLPSNWTFTSLGDLLEEEDVRAGDAAPELEVLSLTKRFGLVPQADRFTKRVATEDTTKYKVVKQGWIVYNPFVIWEGAVHSLRRPNPGVVSPAYVVWRTREDDHGFLDYVLRSPELIRSYERLSAGAVNRRRSISKRDFLSIEIACPPLVERRQIADLLTLIQDSLLIQQRLAGVVTELKDTLLERCFRTGLRPTELVDSAVGPIPTTWAVASVGEIARLSSGGTPSRSKPEFWEGGTIPWVKTGEVTNSLITTAGESITDVGLAGSSAKIFPAGTLLMAMYGQGKTRGQVGILGMDAATNQACVAFFPEPEILTDYLFYLFQARYREVRAFGHGANQPNLSAEIIKGINIAYPKDVDEQEEIVGVLRAVDHRLEVADRTQLQLQGLFEMAVATVTTGHLQLPALEQTHA